MKNRFFLLIIYVISIFSISAMDETSTISKTIINIQNNTKSSIIFSYNNIEDISINSKDQKSIVIPTFIEEYNLNTYLHMPYTIPVAFKIGQNAKIKSGNTIILHEIDNYYAIYKKDKPLCLLNKQKPTTLYFRHDPTSNYNGIGVKNLLSNYIKLKYKLYLNSRKIRTSIENIHTNETAFVNRDATLIIPIIYQKVFLKKQPTKDIFSIKLSENKNCVEIINQYDTVLASFPLKKTMFNIDTQEIEPLPIQ